MNRKIHSEDVPGVQHFSAPPPTLLPRGWACLPFPQPDPYITLAILALGLLAGSSLSLGLFDSPVSFSPTRPPFPPSLVQSTGSICPVHSGTFQMPLAVSFPLATIKPPQSYLGTIIVFFVFFFFFRFSIQRYYFKNKQATSRCLNK